MKEALNSNEIFPKDAKNILNEAIDYIHNMKQNDIKCECDLDNERDKSKRKPFSNSYFVECLNLFCQLFNIKCYHNIPNRMNEIYYRYGQMKNFRKGLTNVLNIG